MTETQQPSPAAPSPATADRALRNLAAMLRRRDGGHLDGRNADASVQGIENHLATLRAYFAACAESAEDERRWKRYAALERRAYRLPS